MTCFVLILIYFFFYIIRWILQCKYSRPITFSTGLVNTRPFIASNLVVFSKWCGRSGHRWNVYG